ncbi:MAG: pyruvate kinase [Bacteroidota bacterium]
MKIKSEEISKLIQQIDQLMELIRDNESNYESELSQTHPMYSRSARNLIHYDTFREIDLRKVQKQLQNLGLSRLAKAEEHILSSLIKTRFILYKLLDKNPPKSVKSGLSIKKSKRIARRNSKELLGYRSKGRRVRIMVTQPTESATNYQLVFDMVKNGMNCARINCAHDNEEVWMNIINHIHKASEALDKKVKIAMDLAGPKIRTGAIELGPEIRKFSSERDEKGVLVHPSIIQLVPEITSDSPTNALPLPESWLHLLKVGDVLSLTDTRGKRRELKIVRISESNISAYCNETTYFETGQNIVHDRDEIPDTSIGKLPAIEQYLLLRIGDELTITKDNILGQPATIDDNGNILTHAHISCQVPEIFDYVTEGDVILFDDGKIEGVIKHVSTNAFVVTITRAKEKGTKLKAEKGINFPNTDLGLSGLTEKDKKDLAFVVKHADVVNFSFVNSKQDVEDLLDELEKLDALEDTNIILKIETRLAFINLKDILLTAMRTKHIGVMIARGDLAVETGWDDIGRIQEEILLMCNSAHIPVVWATQVLESFAKKGLPSRAEITDVVNSLRADCVMLNKGPYIKDVLILLNRILGKMENYHEKNHQMLPKLEKT